jgi:hypothetical protein
VLEDISYAHGGCQMKDDITSSGQFQKGVPIQDGLDTYEETTLVVGILFKFSDIIKGAGGQVIDDIDVIPPFQAGFRKMRTNKTGTSGDQDTHGKILYDAV